MSQYNVSVLINGNIAGYRRAMSDGERSTRSFTAVAQREFQKLRDFARSTQGQLAGLGLSVGMVQLQRQAAQLEKTLTQVRLTAGMTAQQQTEAYQRMFDMVRRNGGVLEDTLAGFNSLIQAGLTYQQAMKATEAINIARSVTGANDQTLASALTVSAANFNLDLAKGNTAIDMLDKMTVSGRLGNAELENLSSIIPRVASGAQRAGMDFEKMLSFLQALSLVEKQPERLATLADSTLRLFTNMRYAKDAEKALGIRMFDSAGARRDPVAVLEDIRQKYSQLTTDAQRFKFMGIAFGQTDLDTQRGLSALLSGEMLSKIREFEGITRGASGTLQGDLETATDNAIDQGSRLKNTLREAAEGFARPINDAFSRATKWALDNRDKGGMGLSGGQLIGAAAGAAGLAYTASRLLPPLMRGIAGRFGGVGAGVAAGKALENAAGITPVYVVNWAEMNGGGAVGALGTAGAAATGAAAVGMAARLRNLVGAGLIAGSAPVGAAGLGATLAGVGAAGAVGYGAGSLIYKGIENTSFADKLGEGIARLLGAFGNEEAQRAVAVREALASSRVGGEVTVRVHADPGVRVDQAVRPFNGTRMTADVGQTNQGTGW